MDAREPATFKNVAAADRFQKGESEEEIDARRQIERVEGELVGDLVRRISDDRLAIGQHPGFGEEIADKIQVTVVDQIARYHYVAMITQHPHDRTATGARLPYP